MSTWIVTGASRGLGRQLALQLAARGHEVLACARDSDALRALAVSNERIRPTVLDLSRGDAIAATMVSALDRIDDLAGLINNAGIGHYKPFVDHTGQELLDILQVNLLATMQLCHAVLPRLLAQGRGHIVNIGSDLGRRPLANMAPYVASKHGLAGFSHSLLREVKDRGVRVSLVQPGLIDTGFNGGIEGSRADPASALDPGELARAILGVIDAPAHLVIDELTVHPVGQREF
jgi:short-subunit dehydrogenase